jgi:DegV family protein with EDD domain
MRKFVIVTDSTCDLPQTFVEQTGVGVIPMEFTVGELTYLNFPDERELSTKEFYRLLREEVTSKTSQITVCTYMDIFDKILEAGHDILYLCFSSSLSGSYDSSLVAARELAVKYPQRRIYPVDTKCASMGEGLLVCRAAEKKREGCTLEEVKTWVEEYRDKVCHWFIVDDLNHLKRGGRLSAATAALGTLLNLKPVLRVNRDGKLLLSEKAHGRKKALNMLADKMKETCQEPNSQMVFISHGDCAEDAECLANLVRRRFGVKEVVVGWTGPIIGSHTGPGMLGLYYFGNKT